MFAPSRARTASVTMALHHSQPWPGRCLRLTTIPLKKVPIRPQGRNSKSSVQGSQRTASRATMIHESCPCSFHASRTGARYSFSRRVFSSSRPPSPKAMNVPHARSRTSSSPNARAPSRAPARRNVPRQRRNTRLTSSGRTRPSRPPASADRATSAKPAKSHKGANALIHPRYKQMLARVRMAVNSMSLPEIRGNPIQAKPVRSTRPEAKAVRLSLPVARARAHVRRIRKSADRAEARGRSWTG